MKENAALKHRVRTLHDEVVALRGLSQSQDFTTLAVEPVRPGPRPEFTSVASIIAHSRATVVYHLPKLTTKVRGCARGWVRARDLLPRVLQQWQYVGTFRRQIAPGLCALNWLYVQLVWWRVLA